MAKKHLVWDLPTRAFHWLLAVSIIAQWITAELLDGYMQWHFYLGYFILGLIGFRFVWGFVGTYHAKFSTQLSSPAQIFNYMKSIKRGSTTHYAGHNPIGAWFLPVLLAALALQAISGLFVTDDIFASGPYYSSASEPLQSLMNWLHHNVINLIWGLIVLHLLAIALHQFVAKEQLIQSMVHGKKTLQHGSEPLVQSSRLMLALIIAACVAIAVTLLVNLAPEVDVYYY